MTLPELEFPVATVDDAYPACDPEAALERGDPRWVDLNPARGGFDLAMIVAQRISRTRLPSFHKQLVTGHRGSGKSTEIKQLQARLHNDLGFFTVYFDAFDVLDPQDIEYVDVLLGIAQAVYAALDSSGIAISPALLYGLEDWFNETFIITEEREDKETTVKAEIGVGVKVPFLNLLSNLSRTMKVGGARKREVRQKLERELHTFLSNLNELLDDVQVRLAEAKWKGLVVLVDNLEKMLYQVRPDGQTNHAALFVHHAEQLKAPRCHIVYTVPVSLVFNLNLLNDYQAVDIIPMIKLFESDGATRYPRGRDALLDVVARRVAIAEVFEAEASVKRLAEMSGGVVRDLMRLVRFACDEADTRITAAHAERAVREMVREYDYLVQEADLDRLVDIAHERNVAGDETSGRLLYNRLVLEYRNDERWYDLHPAVRAGRRMGERLKRPATESNTDGRMTPEGEGRPRERRNGG